MGLALCLVGLALPCLVLGPCLVWACGLVWGLMQRNDRALAVGCITAAALAYLAGRASSSRRSTPLGRAPSHHHGPRFTALPGAGFFEKLAARAEAVDSLLCVGLDPHGVASAKQALEVCKQLVDQTKEIALAYKPNMAFFEAWGSAGIAALEQLVEHIPCDIPIILDAKRGDIGSTAKAYAASAFERFGVESVTVNAYMGYDTVEPVRLAFAAGDMCPRI